jgi:hypothetical protein
MQGGSVEPTWHSYSDPSPIQMEAETPCPAICHPTSGSVPVFLTTPAEAISSLHNFVHGELHAVNLIHQELFLFLFLFFFGSVKDTEAISGLVDKTEKRKVIF